MTIPSKYLPLCCFAMAFTACVEKNFEIAGDESYEMTPIRLSAAYPTLTRASDAGFENGDKMGVFVLDYSGDQRQSITSNDIHASNVKFKFNETDNSWTGASDIYWSSNETPADIIGYYPFDSSLEDPTSVAFSISRRQDVVGSDSELGGYEESDFLWAKAVKVMPTSSRVDLTFSHRMAGVKVILRPTEGFDDSEWENLEKTVTIQNIIPKATINLEDGSVAVGSDNPITVTPYMSNGEWRAIVVPQTLSAGNLISITIDGVNYNLSKSEAFTYSQGKLHTFTIDVKRKQNDGQYEFSLSDETVTAWIDDVEFRDGIMREYVVVNVPERGTLQETFSKLQLSPSNITNLKLEGEIDENDFTFIRENFDYIKAINLNDAEIYSDGEKEVLPPYALYYKETLNHITFPKNLKIIGSCAFTGSGLMGDLIIPEGVTHIGTDNKLDEGSAGHWNSGWGVFSDCASLVGSLSLPSTLEFIESYAFCRAPFTGELIIPDGVSFIGSCAFDNSKFTGTLSLPDDLVDIGLGAFYCVPFTGNLYIPQGVKKIREFTFTNGDYSLLTLPEGIIEIDNHAFEGCNIRGELKLPSTLKRIGDNAFSSNLFSSIIFPENLVYMGNECFSYNSRLSGTLEIPSKITAINHGAFEGCTLLEDIVIGENITKIEGGAFAYCYNLTSIVVNNPEPPLLTLYGGADAFSYVPKDNFTLQVPESSIESYQQASGWKEFKRIAAYSNFVCRPSAVCALTTAHQESLILNSDGDWEITHKPDWCTISKTSGSNKSELTLTVNAMSKGSGNRTDYVEFSLKGTDFTTKCTISQYDYQYDEEECLTLQTHTKGNGIDILFIGDGFDGEAISKGSYMDLVSEQIEAFFGVEPFITYRDYFNVYACINLSQETGVNTANTWRNTRFMTFVYYDMCGNPILAHDDTDAIFDYAVENSPLSKERLPQSLIIMALNTDEYGGATTLTWNGNAISICPISSDPYPMDTRGIVQHEACGHSFGKLGEERIEKNQYVTSTQRSLIEEMHDRGWYQNLSTTSKMTDVPWSHFIFDTRYSDKVDVYEGGLSFARGVFRSEINSCMNQGIPYFNAISRQDIMKRILEYSGEEFTMEKFYATDSDKWGSTSTTRAAMPSDENAYINSGLHHPVRIIKSKKY